MDDLYAVIGIDGLLRAAQSASRGNFKSVYPYESNIRQAYAPTVEQSSESVDIQWDEWGPPITRWFSEDEIYDASLRCISGSRILLRQRGLRAAFRENGVAFRSRKEGVRIFDFNLRPAMRSELAQDAASERTVDIHGEVVDGTKVVRGEKVVEIRESVDSAHDIISSLPYRVIDLPALPSDPYYDYYLDEHTILGRDVSLIIVPLVSSDALSRIRDTTFTPSILQKATEMMLPTSDQSLSLSSKSRVMYDEGQTAMTAT